jgi:predicted phage tail component-like protein
VINGGFTLGGKTAKELGIIMVSTSRRPILPNTVDRTLTIPGRNGAWDYGADVGPRQIQLDCAVMQQNAYNLQSTVESVASLLVDGFGKPRTLELVFDLRPDRFFRVRYVGSLDIERIIGFGRFTLPLLAFDPFAYSLYSVDEINVDSPIPVDTDISVDATYEFSVNGPTTLNIDNFGKLYVQPIIEISGSFTTLTITTNGKTLAYNAAISGQTLIIDCDKYTAKISNTNVLGNVSGEFPVFTTGNNVVNIGGSGLDLSITFKYRLKFA